jgi:hypothetical protein
MLTPKQRDEHFKKLRDLYPKADGVEYNINARWEGGTPHHPKSIALMKRLSDIDWIFCNDHFCWKVGGDGDNGESLMFMLDIIFEEDDKREAETLAGDST